MPSVSEQIATLPPEIRAEALSCLTNEEADALLYDWRGFLARPEQIAPEGDWDIWLALAGRGWGKTEAGAQWVKEQEAAGARQIALVAETQKDLEEVMVPRLLGLYRDHERPHARFRPVRITWPSGAIARGYNGTEPNQLRGPEFDAAWVDELAKWRYARDTWDMLQFGLRVGDHPRVLATTTPRPIELIKSIVAGKEGKAVVTRGSTSENRANLSKRFLEKIETRYAGTRLGRQELNAEILGDLPGALWRQEVIDTYREKAAGDRRRTVVAVDPAVTNEDESNDHGIVVMALDENDEGRVIADESMAGSPGEWANKVAELYREHSADTVVAEVNQGGDMVEYTIKSVAPNINVTQVRATKGKHVRAEPIAALYEQGRIRHVGQFPELENQMTQMTQAGYEGDGSPDRVDALVWAATELFPDIAEPPADASKFAYRPRVGGFAR